MLNLLMIIQNAFKCNLGHDIFFPEGSNNVETRDTATFDMIKHALTTQCTHMCQAPDPEPA